MSDLMDLNVVTICDLSKYPLNAKQMEILRALRVPLYHNYSEDLWYVAEGYWHSIKPALQEALVTVVSSHE